ncbi:MAG: 23S rRNA (uracil(1939)-C(5))-methyltransferase RlmD [Pseudomonadota bacterium]|nr:23S rRNA (uracil(1939)-C(5))-methyltransferase RlmD [Pseudomonadota bacterium]
MSEVCTEELYELEITDYDHQGRGIGRHEGKVCFAYDVLVGEKIAVTKQKLYKNFNYIEKFNLIRKQSQRVIPKCRSFGRCGGCSLQHMHIKQQEENKIALCKEQLEHAGLGCPPITFVSSQAYNYRRKARFSVRYSKKLARIWFGFRHIHLPKVIVDVDECPILVPQLTSGLKKVKNCITQLSIPDFIPQVEVLECQGKCSAIIRHLKPLTDKDREVITKCAKDLGWYIFLQSSGITSTVLLWGPTSQVQFALEQKGYKVQVGVHDFMQINEPINAKLVDAAVDALRINKNDTIADLFCGVGNFTLAIAKKAKTVIGIDVSKEMITKAEENAKSNNIETASFACADLFSNVKILTKHKFDKYLIDPPRSGAQEVIMSMPENEIKKIVYVSCNIQTFLRDAVLLKGKGYSLQTITLFDMFAQTKHVELLGVFTQSL